MRFRTALFWILLLLLPLAEWKGIVLPVHGKDLTVDWTGRASVSPFDLVFLVFSCYMLPSFWDAIRTRRILSPYLASWWVAFVLAIVLYFVLKPSWPLLTPSQVNVINTRTFIYSVAVMVFVALFIASCPIQRIVSSAFTVCVVAAASLLILSVLAFAQLDFFYTYYPFANPQAITFPFPSQNIAALFIVLCLLGLLGTATLLDRPWHLALGMPLFVLAVALTGSRSNFAVLVLAVPTFWLAYSFHLFRARHDVRLCSPWVIVPALAGAMLVVVAGYDWQPIRRSSSILTEAIGNPLTPITSWRYSPRSKLSSLALSGADVSRLKLNRDYGLALVSVVEGCIAKSEAISGLKVEKPVFVRFRLAGTHDGRQAILDIFRDQQRTQLLGTRRIALPKKTYPNLYLFAADSGERYTVVQGSLSNFKLHVTPGSAPRDPLDLQRVFTYEDRLSGAATPIIAMQGGTISFNAYSNRLRGYVQAFAVNEGLETTLEYELKLVGTTNLLLAPADMFYVGFHDTVIGADKKAWETVRNAVLIQHIRKISDHESYIFAYHEAAAQAEALKEDTALLSLSSEARAQVLNARNRCGEGGRIAISRLGKPPLIARLIDVTQGDHFGAVVKDADSLAAAKVPAELWSPAMHLKFRGSTHNIYLDWYYYVGFWPLLGFLLFVVLLTGALFARLWQGRRALVFPFLLAVTLQVVVIFGLLFVHPNLWSRYIWFTFGIASGLLIHREINQPEAGRLS